MEPKEYTLGFAFDSTAQHAVLLLKQRPDHLAGLWAGVGGHIEAGENPAQCMHREAIEEAGLYLRWEPFALVDSRHLESDDPGHLREPWVVYAYRVFDDRALTALTKTDERVAVITLPTLLPMTELSAYLLPMALCRRVKHATVVRT